MAQVENVRIIYMKFKYTKFNPILYEAHMQALSFINDGEKVLDIGCATGYFAERLKEKNCQVFGVEIDRKAAKIAEKHCEKVFVGNVLKINSLSIPKRSFDTVLMLDILEHLKNPEKALSIAKSYAKRRGKLIISTPNITHISIRLNLLFGRFDYQDMGIMDKSHLRFFTKKSLIRIVKNAGLKIRKIDYSADFGQISLVGRFLKRIPKRHQYRLTKFFNTLLPVQFIVVCH